MLFRSLTSNLTNRQIVAESNYALTWSLYTGAVGGFLILTLGAVCHHPWIGLAFAVALPVVLAQDVLRLTAIALGRPGLAVVADALWAAPMLGIFVANLFGVRESAEFSLYLWAALSALPAILVLGGVAHDQGLQARSLDTSMYPDLLGVRLQRKDRLLMDQGK